MTVRTDDDIRHIITVLLRIKNEGLNVVLFRVRRELQDLEEPVDHRAREENQDDRDHPDHRELRYSFTCSDQTNSVFKRVVF